MHGSGLVYGSMTGSLRPEDVVPRLRGRLGREYRFVERCTSTQRLLGEDDPEGTVVVADEQTEGRGRLGRQWLAPAGTSLLFSVLLRPDVEAARLPELSLVAGRACAEASDGRVVLGVGVNVGQQAGQLPTGARTPATSLLLETGREIDRAELLVALLDRLERRYNEWLADDL